MSSSNEGHWIGRASKVVMDIAQVGNPIEAINILSNDLVRLANISVPPIDPFQLAALRKIHTIDFEHIRTCGLITKDLNGYRVVLGEGQSLPRSRFSCAHEIGHTFFLDRGIEEWSKECAIGDIFNSKYEEERLCDIAAADLLMPKAMFRKFAADAPETLDGLDLISSVFVVSPQATLRRLIELNLWHCLFIVWKWAGNGAEVCPRVSWASAPKGYFIPHRAKAPPTLEVDEEQSGGGTTEVSTDLRRRGKKLGNLSGTFTVETKGYGSISQGARHNYALSLVHLGKK